MVDASDGISGLRARLLEQLADEHSTECAIAFPVSPGNWKRGDDLTEDDLTCWMHERLVNLLRKLADDVAEDGFVESAPKQDGRNMTMVLGPHKKKAEAKVEHKAAKEAKAAERAAEEAEERAERTERNAGRQAAPKKERGRSENLDPEIEA